MQKLKAFLKRNNLQVYIVVLGLMIAFQIFQYSGLRSVVADFIGAGPRFTSVQALHICERIQALEKHAGLKVGNCDFDHVEHVHHIHAHNALESK